MLDALLAGVIAGYAIAIPVGAIAALLITLGAQHGARIAADAGAAERLVFVVAAFAASLSWQLLLTTAGAVVGRVLTGPTGARVTALVGGALVIALAIRAALVP